MPTLSSGIRFELEFLSEFPKGMRSVEYEALWQHVCDSATEFTHLYPILSVIYFGSREKAKDNIVELYNEQEKAHEGDVVPYYSGKSLITFYSELDEADQSIVEDYISSKEIQDKLYNYLNRTLYRIRHSFPTQGLYKLGHNPLKNNLLIDEMGNKYYKPTHLAIKSIGLFPQDHEEFTHYASTEGNLRLKPFVRSDSLGIFGTLALGNPPSSKDLDAWDASKRAGVWDYWAFLQFSTVPRGKEGKEIIIYFEESTFFDRPLEIIHRIDITDHQDPDDIEKLWGNFIEELNKRFGLASIEEQKWTVEGIIFDVHSPDET